MTPLHLALSIALHPIIGNVVLPLLLPCRAPHYHHYNTPNITSPQLPLSRTYAVHNPLPLPISEIHAIHKLCSVPLTNVRTSALHYRSKRNIFCEIIYLNGVTLHHISSTPLTLWLVTFGHICILSACSLILVTKQWRCC